MADGSDVEFEDYALNSSISMAANLREALRTLPLLEDSFERVLVMVDTPTLMVPTNEFNEEEGDILYRHTFTGQEQQQVMHTVLPDLNAVVLFSVQKDLRTVIEDNFRSARPSPARRRMANALDAANNANTVNATDTTTKPNERKPSAASAIRDKTGASANFILTSGLQANIAR